MARSTSALQQLKGVGEVLAKRLEAAGLDNFEKIAKGGEKVLQKVPGMPPRSVASIVEQARQLAKHPQTEEQRPKETVLQRVGEVRDQLQAVAKLARDRFQGDLAGKKGKRLTYDLVRLEDALARIEDGGRGKRAGKALLKAQKRISGLEDVSLKKLRKRVKRARKTMVKAVR